MASLDFSNLTDKILVATPYAMEGSVFYKSLIYMLQHTPNGSIGLIFNHRVESNFFNKLLKKNNDIEMPDLKLNIHLGGPLEMERGFFIHSNEYDEDILFKSFSNNLAVSSNTKILKDIADGRGPKSNIFVIGYTGWTAGQVEHEISNNLWMVIDADDDLIFNSNNSNKWLMALDKLGVSGAEFTPGFGTS